MPRSKVTLIDVVTLTIALGMLFALGIPFVVRSREYAGLLGCSRNLKQIGLAILFYSNNNKGAYPHTRASADPSWWTAYSNPLKSEPFEEDGPLENDVTASLFLLLRTQQITPDVFVCPMTKNLTPWDFGGRGRAALDCANFPSGRHLAYSYINPYPSAAAKKAGYKLNNSISAETPVMADMNPGGIDLLQLTASSPPKALKRGNSRNHYQGWGQCVLFGDGHVEPLQSPFVGVQRDNIYTFGKSGAAGGGDGIIGSPVDANDSVLLPVASIDPGSPSNSPWEKPAWPKYFIGGAVCLFALACAMLLRRRRRLRKPESAG